MESERTVTDGSVVHISKGEGLCILHRFENSAISNPTEIAGKTILASYGKAHGDFSAQAWLYEL